MKSYIKLSVWRGFSPASVCFLYMDQCRHVRRFASPFWGWIYIFNPPPPLWYQLDLFDPIIIGFWSLSPLIFIGVRLLWHLFSNFVDFCVSHFQPLYEHLCQHLDQYHAHRLYITQHQLIQHNHITLPSVFVTYLRLFILLGFFRLGGIKWVGQRDLKTK